VDAHGIAGVLAIFWDRSVNVTFLPSSLHHMDVFWNGLIVNQLGTSWVFMVDLKCNSSNILLS